MSTYLLPYITGTVATTSGSSTVTGTLTAWLSQVQPGDNFRIGSASAIVASVDSNTQITLLTTWGTTATGQSYAIDRWSQGHSAPGTLALRNSQLLESLGTGYTMQSPTSLAIGVGSKAFDVAAGVPILPGARMIVASRADLANAMWGTVTSYSGTTIVLNVEAVSGSGTFADWNINIAGATTQGAPGELTRSGAQTGGLMQWASNTQAKEVPSTNVDGSGKIGLNIVSGPTGRLHVGGAINCAMETNAFGTTSIYPALVVGDTQGAATVGNGGLYAIARHDRSLEPFTGLCGWAVSGSRTLYLGGGGWGVPDATRLLFYTGANVETNNSGAIRLDIRESGSVLPGADNTQSFGASTLRWSAIYAANGTIQTSDARDKIEAGRLDGAAGGMVDAVSPVLFRWKVGGNDVAPSATETETLEDGRVVPKMVVTPKPGKRVHAGFFAQDVKAAMDAAGVEFGAWGIDDKDAPESRQWVRPDQLIPVLWQALRETRAELKALKSRIGED